MFLNILLDDIHVADNVCADSNVLKAIRFVGYLLTLAKLFIPLIIVGFGIFDLYKSVISAENTLTKQLKSIGFRVIIGLLIFFIPNFVNIVLGGLTSFEWISEDYRKCEICLLKPFSCEISDDNGGLNTPTNNNNNSTNTPTNNNSSTNTTNSTTGGTTSSSGQTSKKNCNQYVGECPSVDDYGNTCKTEGLRCKIQYIGGKKSCFDYPDTQEECPAKDEHGNICTFTNGKCTSSFISVP